MRLRRAVRHIALAAFAAAASAVTSAPAQEVQRIAAVVNDDIISVFDLVERMKLVIFSSGLRDTPEVTQRIAPQVLRTLIDERLRLQEAELNNVSVSEAEQAIAIADIEKRNDIPPNRLDEFLRARRIDAETVRAQVRAEIAWGKLLRRRLQSSLVISDDLIDERLARLTASRGVTEHLISEIFLVVESPEAEHLVRRNAQRVVEEIRAGASFAALAAQLSLGVTAAQGGDVGWMIEDQLSPELAEAVARLEAGKVSDPIRANGGYLIVQLRDRRQRLTADPNDTQVSLMQILLPLAEGVTEAGKADLLAHAGTIRNSIGDCDDMRRKASEIDSSTSGDLGTVHVRDLPPHLRKIVRELPVGTVSQPVSTKLGVHLLMVCDRIAAKPDLPDREQVRRSLLGQRLELLSRRYLRDLRRSAFIDKRI